MPAVTVVDYGGMAGQPLHSSGKEPKKLVFGTWSPGVYATGGVTMTGLDPSYLSEVEGVLIMPHALYTFVYSAGTVIGYVTNTGAQIANSTDLSGTTLQFMAWGKV